MKNVTVVMYHYVRDLSISRYPKIKGLELKNFIKQLDYLNENFTFIRMEDCLEAVDNFEADFPENAVLLTFDDGYAEHFTHVFPILDRRGIQGAFFPPVQSTMENKVLDVNKIHFVLASSDNPAGLLNELSALIKEYQSEFGLLDPDDYYNSIESSEHAYDPIEIIRFKRVLQRELPFEAREVIVDRLFQKYVGIPEDLFSNELYMNEDQLKLMDRKGMYIGGHGYSHRWLNAIGNKEQDMEFKKTKSFLLSLGLKRDELVMCYPYGAYNNHSLELMKAEGFSLGLTTKSGVGKLSGKNRYELSREDTNEIGW